MEWIKTYSLDHLNDICNMDEDRGALRSARPSLFTGPTPEPAFFRHFAANRADGSIPAGGLCRPQAEEIPARTAINLIRELRPMDKELAKEEAAQAHARDAVNRGQAAKAVLRPSKLGGKEREMAGQIQRLLSTLKPQACSKVVGTYFTSLFLRTHSLSTAELSYCSGESPSCLTIWSKEVGAEDGTASCSGLFQFLFPRVAIGTELFLPNYRLGQVCK